MEKNKIIKAISLFIFAAGLVSGCNNMSVRGTMIPGVNPPKNFPKQCKIKNITTANPIIQNTLLESFAVMLQFRLNESGIMTITPVKQPSIVSSSSNISSSSNEVTRKQKTYFKIDGTINVDNSGSGLQDSWSYLFNFSIGIKNKNYYRILITYNSKKQLSNDSRLYSIAGKIVEQIKQLYKKK